MLPVGTLVDNRYVVVGVIGEGGMARVFKVRHAVLESFHALKVLAPELVMDTEIRQRFLGEGRLLAKLRHPNIVSVTDVVISPVAGLVMDYLEGAALGDYVHGLGRPVEPAMVRRIFGEVLSGIGYAHARGIIHRDLKPSNIFLERTDDGSSQVKVRDFGIAKVGSEPGTHGTTRTGARMGTPQYMSPEQIRGARDVDQRSDIFSLGAILHELVTGRVCFDGESDFDIQLMIIEGRQQQPEALNPEVDPVLAAAVRRALSRNPDERFQSCDEFAEALRQAAVPAAVITATPVESPVIAPAQPTAPPSAPVAPAAAEPAIVEPGPEAAPAAVATQPEIVEPARPARPLWTKLVDMFFERPEEKVAPVPPERQPAPEPRKSAPAAPKASPPSKVARPPAPAPPAPAPKPLPLAQVVEPAPKPPPPRTQVRFTGKRFVVSKDGETVLDQKTGLTWQRNVSAQRFTFESAELFAQSLMLEGTGWRLPTREELEALVELDRRPAIDSEAFPDTPAEWFWTASRYTSSSKFVWVVSFETGYSADLFATSWCRARYVRS